MGHRCLILAVVKIIFLDQIFVDIGIADKLLHLGAGDVVLICSLYHDPAWVVWVWHQFIHAWLSGLKIASAFHNVLLLCLSIRFLKIVICILSRVLFIIWDDETFYFLSELFLFFGRFISRLIGAFSVLHLHYFLVGWWACPHSNPRVDKQVVQFGLRVNFAFNAQELVNSLAFLQPTTVLRL